MSAAPDMVLVLGLPSNDNRTDPADVARRRSFLDSVARGGCYECGCAPGDVHDTDCLVERCPLCGGQCYSCMCPFALAGYVVTQWDIGGMLSLRERYPELRDISAARWGELFAAHDDECDRVGRIPWGSEHLAPPRRFITLAKIDGGRS